MKEFLEASFFDRFDDGWAAHSISRDLNLHKRGEGQRVSTRYVSIELDQSADNGAVRTRKGLCTGGSKRPQFIRLSRDRLQSEPARRAPTGGSQWGSKRCGSSEHHNNRAPKSIWRGSQETLLPGTVAPGWSQPRRPAGWYPDHRTVAGRSHDHQSDLHDRTLIRRLPATTGLLELGDMTRLVPRLLPHFTMGNVRCQRH